MYVENPLSLYIKKQVCGWRDYIGKPVYPPRAETRDAQHRKEQAPPTLRSYLCSEQESGVAMAGLVIEDGIKESDYGYVLRVSGPREL